MTDAGVLAALAAELRAQGGLVGVEARAPAQGTATPLADRAGPVHGYLVEAIHEGERLHYGQGRVMRPADPDLALLAGDRLYALGLEELAARADLHATAVLADVISACARAHAEGDEDAAAAAWADGLARIAAAP